MKILLIICITFFCSLSAIAMKKPYESRLKIHTEASLISAYKVKKAFFCRVNNTQNQLPETVHRDNCSRTSNQCRNNWNDTVISGQPLPLALIVSTEKLFTSPVLPFSTSTLSRLLLFPNHYFW